VIFPLYERVIAVCKSFCVIQFHSIPFTYFIPQHVNPSLTFVITRDLSQLPSSLLHQIYRLFLSFDHQFKKGPQIKKGGTSLVWPVPPSSAIFKLFIPISSAASSPRSTRTSRFLR
jgi:hypothetical protein